MAQAETRAETKKARPRLVKSTFALALAGFVVLNAVMSFVQPIDWNPYKFPYKGWAWWMINDLRKGREMHNLALLGSSVMVSAVASCDANYTKKSLDLTCYHKATYLDHKLRTKFGGRFNTYNLSSPGQMPSDAYLALKAMVNCAHRPDIVVYGVFPRDFIDSTLSSPADTEPYRYLHRLVNLDDVYAAIFRSPFTKLDWWLHRECYLYGFSLDFQMAAADAATAALASLVPKPYNNPPFTWWDRVRILPTYMPGEIHAEAVMTSPMNLKMARDCWRDNTTEYMQRYRSPDPHTYRTQINFLQQIAKFCHKERMELIVVNVPVMPYHIGMLKPGIYTKYVQAMKEEAIRGDYTFYDLCDLSRYQQDDFIDPVHMNGFGGKKLFDHLVDMLVMDKRSAGALVMAGQELERHQELAATGRARLY